MSVNALQQPLFDFAAAYKEVSLHQEEVHILPEKHLMEYKTKYHPFTSKNPHPIHLSCIISMQKFHKDNMIHQPICAFVNTVNRNL